MSQGNPVNRDLPLSFAVAAAAEHHVQVALGNARQGRADLVQREHETHLTDIGQTPADDRPARAGDGQRADQDAGGRLDDAQARAQALTVCRST